MDVRGFGLSEDDLRQLGFRLRSPEGGSADTGGGGGGAVPPGRPRRRASPAFRAWVSALVVLALVGWGASSRRGLPRPVPVAAADTAFSSARALAQLVEVSREARPLGSPEHARVSTLLLGRLRSLGLEAELRPEVAAVRDSLGVRAATVRNIVARVPGGGSDSPGVLLTAHYDGPPGSPAASANGIGVATVLEVARALAAGTPPPSDVTIVLLDAGAVGELGRRVPPAPFVPEGTPRVEVSAWGGSGPSVPVVGVGSYEPGVVRALGGRTLTSLSRALLREPNVAAAAQPAVHIVVPGGRAVRGRASDTAAGIDERTLQMVGDQALASVRAVGRVDASPASASREGVYHTIPFAGAVRYDAVWVLPTAAALVLLWGFLVLLVRARRAGRNGVIIGLGMGGALLAGAWWLGRGLVTVLERTHPEVGALDTLTYRDGPHALALALLVGALVMSVYAIARRRVRSDELFVGASLLPLGAATWGAVALPDAGPAFQWPLAIGLLAMIYVTLLGPARTREAVGWVGVILMGAAALFALVPAVQLLVGVWTLREAEWLAAVVVLASLAFLPVVALVTGPRAWMGPAGAVLASLALIGLQLPDVRGGAAHPVPSTLVYLTEEPVPTGPLVSRDPDAVVDPGAPRAMAGEWLIVPGAGERWARSWVAEPPAGALAAGPLLIEASPSARWGSPVGRRFVDGAYQRAGGAPNAEIPPPRVELVGAATADGRGVLDLTVASRFGAEMIGLLVPEGEDLEIVGVGEVGWQGPDAGETRLVHWGDPGEAGLPVRVVVPAGTRSISLQVVEHHLRPASVLGAYFYQRPDSLEPNNALGSDRLVQRTLVRIPVTEDTIRVSDGGS